MSTVAELSQRVEKLEKMILGMKKEIGTLRDGGPIAVEPGGCIKSQDAEDCPYASTYRYQKGCRGASCKRANSEYYNKGGVRDQAKQAMTETPVAKPKKAAPIKKAVAKKPSPVKPVAKKGLLKRA